MLIHLGACSQKDTVNILENSEKFNQNKPQILESENSKPLGSIENQDKKNIDTYNQLDREKNSNRVRKVFKKELSPKLEKDFSQRFIDKDNNKQLNQNKQEQKNSFVSKNDKQKLKQTPEFVKSRVKVGLLLPLTGVNSEIGRAMLNASTMAIFDLSDQDFELLPRDTLGTPEGSIEAINNLIVEGAEMILGPIFSASVKAISPIAQSSNITVIAFSNDSSISGTNIFSLGFSPEQQIQRVVNFASDEGVVNFAAIVPNSAYGEKVLGAILEYVPQSGGVLTRIEKYEIDQGDFRNVIKKITDYKKRKRLLEASKEQLIKQGDPVALKTLERLQNKETMGEVDFEAILIPEGGERLRSIVPLLAFYDVDPRSIKILGTGLWNEKNIGLEPALVGGWFASPSPKIGENFRKNYKKIYGRHPPRLASLAYDATALAIVLSRDKEKVGVDLTLLKNNSGFTGIDGLFRFKNQGLVDRGLAILEIRKNDFKIIDPSPESFD